MNARIEYAKVVSAGRWAERANQDKVQTILGWVDKRQECAVAFAFRISDRRIATFWAKFIQPGPVN